MAKILENKNMFESTLMALKNSQAKSKATLNEKKKNVSTKKVIKESVKALKEEDEIIDDDTVEVPADTADDIILVNDPNMSQDEYDDNLDTLQQILDDTPEGETPIDDQYVGQMVYTCPVCGEKFFSEVEMHDGECPLCHEISDDFILNGEVESPEEAEDEVGEEEVSGEEEVIDEPSGEEIVDDEEEVKEEDVDVTIIDADKVEDEVVDDMTDTSDEVIDDVEELEPSYEEESKKVARRTRSNEKRSRRVPTKYSLDERVLNSFMTKFIRENYKNAERMSVRNAVVCGESLILECAVRFKSGKMARTKITVEGFKPAPKMKLVGHADSFFKVEGKRNSAFKMEAIMKNNVVRVNSFKYDFQTKNEGKRLKVYGSYIRG